MSGGCGIDPVLERVQAVLHAHDARFAFGLLRRLLTNLPAGLLRHFADLSRKLCEYGRLNFECKFDTYIHKVLSTRGHFALVPSYLQRRTPASSGVRKYLREGRKNFQPHI